MNNALNEFLFKIQQTGLSIDVVYDIGCWKGVWSYNLKNSVLPNSQFFLFEANPAYEQILSESGFPCFMAVLSNPGRESVEFYNGTNTGDSYYKENTTEYDNQGYITLPCITLDQVIKECSLPIPNFIKLDTQGSELDVLAGAESIINQVDLIFTECPIIRYNIGSPTIQDYLDYFKQHNFIPIDLLEKHISEETLMQVDIMFVRKEIKDKFLTPNIKLRP
jgi:FkbM family methyltransferase